MVKPLSTSRFVLADHHLRRYVCNPVEGTTLDDVLQANFFVNILHELIPGRTIITVLSEDTELFAEVMVMEKTKTTATCRVVHVYWEPGDNVQHRETVLRTSFDDYVVNYGGPHHKHRILHGTQIVETGFNTKQSAEQRLAEIKAKAAKK